MRDFIVAIGRVLRIEALLMTSFTPRARRRTSLARAAVFSRTD
jgi:hypothetical protein